jgi:hypothetical protein
MFNFCVIAMIIVCMLINDAKTLEYDLWIKKRERERKEKNQKSSHTCAYGHFCQITT